jgi:uncharacterized surface protein with fasciclin (FAS1) repeats
MHWTRLLTLFTLLTIMGMVLAACGGAPAPQSSGSATASGAPTAGNIPTAANAPTAPTGPTAATAATTQASAFTDHPNDATQARLRLGHFVFGGPHVDLLVNGQVAVNGGQAQVNIPAGYINGYLFLAPGTYRVAVVPTGQGLDQALIGPLDVPVVAGHRYTLAMMGQLQDQSVKPLLIDETAALQKTRTSATQDILFLLNNLVGAKTLGFVEEGDGPHHVGYGGFGVAPLRVVVGRSAVIGANSDPKAALSVEFLYHDGKANEEPSLDFMVSYIGRFPGTLGVDYDVAVASPMSSLTAIDYLKSFSGAGFRRDGQTVSFDAFLAAITTAGLTDMLTSGDPYLILAPTDAAFASVPKAIRDDPKAMAALVRNHIVAGYVPKGSLAKTPGGPFDRTFTNLLGAKLAIGDGFIVNGQEVSDGDSAFVANGTQVHPLLRVLLPATK